MLFIGKNSFDGDFNSKTMAYFNRRHRFACLTIHLRITCRSMRKRPETNFTLIIHTFFDALQNVQSSRQWRRKKSTTNDEPISSASDHAIYFNFSLVLFNTFDKRQKRSRAVDATAQKKM